MPGYNFLTSVSPGDLLPIRGTGFLFNVPGTLQAVMDQFGISCGQTAVLVLSPAVNAIDVDVFAGAVGASITASSVSKSITKQVPSSPSGGGVQTIRFDFTGIESLVFTAKNGELDLQAIG